MIERDEIIEIGKFLKTHALKGELNALMDVELDYVEDGHPLVVEMDGIYVPFFPESVRSKGAESCLIKLKGVDSQEKAQEFVNKEIYGRREDLINYMDDPDAELTEDFIGFHIIDSHLGEIGVVTDVDDSTENVLLVVETPDGETVYIPIAEEFITGIDEEEEKILMNLPEGLVDLNKKADE